MAIRVGVAAVGAHFQMWMQLPDADEISKCGSLTQSILEASFQADGRLDRCV